MKGGKYFIKKLKNYKNLYALYQKSRNSFRIPFFICLILFVLSFVTIFMDVPFELTMTMMLMIIPVIILGITLLVIRWRTARSASKFTEQELAEIDNEIPMHQKNEGFLVTRHAVICGCNKGGLLLYPVKNMLWVYKTVTTGKMYGLIPIYKYTVLVFAGRDKKRRTFTVKNKGNIVEFLRSELSKYRMDIIYGYENGLDTMYRKDINQMIALADEYAKRQRGELPSNKETAAKVNMHTAYLNTLPEIKNKYKVNLLSGEKVIFTANIYGFKSDTGVFIGADCKFTMTNKRIIADNGQGLCIVDIAEDISGWRREESGKGLAKEEYILVTLNKELTYGMGVQKLTGYRFCFKKKDMEAFENIMKNVLRPSMLV